MVRKIKISSVYEAEPEEASEPTNAEADDVQTNVSEANLSRDARNEEASEPTNAEADEVQTPETANTQTTEAIETYTDLS